MLKECFSKELFKKDINTGIDQIERFEKKRQTIHLLLQTGENINAEKCLSIMNQVTNIFYDNVGALATRATVFDEDECEMYRKTALNWPRSRQNGRKENFTLLWLVMWMRLPIRTGKSFYIGLIPFSPDVYRDVPVDQFTLKQKTYFKGAVNNPGVGGQTAMYDALVVRLDTMEKKMNEIGNAKPMIFVPSDRDSNNSSSFKQVGSIVTGLKIPVYTISHNYTNPKLDELAIINEAASISGTSEDIVYKLRNLFNAQM